MVKNALKQFLAQRWFVHASRALSGNSLLVLAYHRIARNGERVVLADSLFGPDELEFESQVSWLARNMKPLSEQDVVEFLRSNKPFPKRAILVTFDDGYRDNFTIAAPILQRHSVPAVFFIPTAPISHRSVSWWDEIAWMAKQTRVQSLTAAGQVYDLSEHSRENAINELIANCKLMNDGSRDGMLEGLRRKCQVDKVPYEVADSALMTWEQITALSDYGISVGGHTVHHCMLSKLDVNAQERELRDSKTELELRTGREVVSIAYPFGGREHFNEETRAAAREIGYRLGFSLVPGINRTGQLDELAICRIIPPSDIDSFALYLTMPKLMLRKKYC
jgi:peptidoglycan/xylan/chitin deacetylase (PgdA/CDA1 family)